MAANVPEEEDLCLQVEGVRVLPGIQETPI